MPVVDVFLLLFICTILYANLPTGVLNCSSKGEGRQRGGGEAGWEVEGLYAKFHVNVCIVSASSGQKPQFWAKFDFWGAPVLTSFYR